MRPTVLSLALLSGSCVSSPPPAPLPDQDDVRFFAANQETTSLLARECRPLGILVAAGPWPYPKVRRALVSGGANVGQPRLMSKTQTKTQTNLVEFEEVSVTAWRCPPDRLGFLDQALAPPEAEP